MRRPSGDPCATLGGSACSIHSAVCSAQTSLGFLVHSETSIAAPVEDRLLAAICSESSLIASILWLIREVPLVERLVSWVHDTESLWHPLGDRKQVVADPFRFIQINSPAYHAIKNGGLAAVAPGQNFDGQRLAINHVSQTMGRLLTQSSRSLVRSLTEGYMSTKAYPCAFGDAPQRREVGAF